MALRSHDCHATEGVFKQEMISGPSSSVNALPDHNLHSKTHWLERDCSAHS